MNTLTELMQPSIDAFFTRINEYLTERRLISIQRQRQVLQSQIDNDMAAIAKLNKDEINLRNQFFLPKGMHL